MHDWIGRVSTGSDGLPYLGISYANGPGSDNHQGPNNTRRDLTDEPESVYSNYSFYISAQYILKSPLFL